MHPTVTMLSHDLRRARKPYPCAGCDGIIPAGTRYWDCRLIDHDDSLAQARFHQDCATVRDNHLLADVEVDEPTVIDLDQAHLRRATDTTGCAHDCGLAIEPGDLEVLVVSHGETYSYLLWFHWRCFEQAFDIVSEVFPEEIPYPIGVTQ